MLDMQIKVLTLWQQAGDRLRQQVTTPRQRDRGEVTAATVLIVLLVIAAITAGGIIANKITTNANNVPSP